MPEITMPKLSDTMNEGTLIRWCKEKGATIEIGDLLAEVETDKATMEMEAFEEGVLTDLFVEAGAKVPVGAPIAFILGKHESRSSNSTEAANSVVAPVQAASQQSKLKDEDEVKDKSEKSNASTSTGDLNCREATAPSTPGSSSASASFKTSPKLSPSSTIRIKASPLARKIAAERGLRLETVADKGTGPGGRIVAADVISAPIGGAAVSGGASSTPAIMPAVIAGNPETQIPLSNMRQVIAQRLFASKTQIPHFYLSIEIDAEPMVSFRKEFIATGNKITFNDIVLLATARAAIEKPKVNAAFAGTSIYQYESVNLCVAIAVEDGLVTPVIRDAQKLSLPEISAAVKDLAVRARDKKLKPEEFAGGTMTVSNLGAYGIDQFCAIINPPQAAILAVGAIVKKPVVNANDEIVIGQRLSITLSGDHRVVDGAVAAEYLGALRKLLEAPSRLLL